MLKTNSKQARANIKDYIIKNFEPEGYLEECDPVPETFQEIATFIYKCFYDEKIKYDKRRMTEYELFEEWCAGLPSVLDTCYYYNRSALNDLGDLLEQTQTERNKYTEQQAEKTLTYLIYKEIRKEI